MIGNIIPPARAVLLGVAGAKIKSTPTSGMLDRVSSSQIILRTEVRYDDRVSFNEASRDKECHCNQPNTRITETLYGSLCIDNAN